jgi:transposase
MKGQSLTMDNAPIRSPVKVRDLVERRGYNCLHRPPYSSFLNRSEELRARIKAGIRMNAVRADDRLGNRIYESVGKVTRADCQGWIRHAVYFFPPRKNE